MPALRHSLVSSVWTAWGQLPGGGATLDAPTAILSGGSLDLFVRGTDNNVYVNRFDGTRYTGWARLPIVATN